MQKTRMDPNNLKHRFIWIVATIAVLAGIFFRFYNLDKRIFWYDETISASHMSGNPDGWYTLLKKITDNLHVSYSCQLLLARLIYMIQAI
jgi:hypothetical protein